MNMPQETKGVDRWIFGEWLVPTSDVCSRAGLSGAPFMLRHLFNGALEKYFPDFSLSVRGTSKAMLFSLLYNSVCLFTVLLVLVSEEDYSGISQYVLLFHLLFKPYYVTICLK